MADLKEGLVLKSTGSWYDVQVEGGAIYRAQMRGKLRNDVFRSTNPIAVGDRVELKFESGKQVIITEVKERKNYLVRKSVNLSRQAHVIAANIDQAVLIATLKQPVTYPGFIDRFTVMAEAFHIPVALVFNKIDLYDSDELKLLEERVKVYRNIGYETLAISALNSDDQLRFRNLLSTKISLLSGNSGVGKSTLINAVVENVQLKTGKISSQHQTGKHTTTFAEMIPLSGGGYVIDTPGLKGFGLIDVEPTELALYFPEMHQKLSECKFYNCTHINEPDCAVKRAVAVGEIAGSRYKSYLSMYDENPQQHYR